MMIDQPGIVASRRLSLSIEQSVIVWQLQKDSDNQSIEGRKLMNKLLSSLVTITAVAALSTTTQAAALPPGGVVLPAGDTAATAPNSTGVVLNDNTIPFSFEITQFTNVGGNVQNRVALSDNLNTMIFAPPIRDVQYRDPRLRDIRLRFRRLCRLEYRRRISHRWSG